MCRETVLIGVIILLLIIIMWHRQCYECASKYDGMVNQKARTTANSIDLSAVMLSRTGNGLPPV